MTTETETRWMGLDVGEVRIGVALSDSTKVMAQPYRIIYRRDDDTAIRSILDLAEEKEVERIVVGIPLAQDSSRGPMARKIAEFTQALRDASTVEVVEWDERFSTQQAKRSLLEGNVRRKKRKESVDKTAAALILQNYIDAQRAGASNPEDRDYVRWAMETDDTE